MTTFYSNGKLLLTGEYLVMEGAKGLAIPTQFGQSMTVEPSDFDGIIWKSYDEDGSLWFEAQFSSEEIKDASESKDIRERLAFVLHHAFEMHGSVEPSGYQIETRLTFPRNWGLGSSSTLICNLAKWLDIDAFGLQEKTFGGSGYDIACGLHDHPILFRREYKNPVTWEVEFNPPFADDIYYVYLNQKQDTRTAIEAYRQQPASDIVYKIAEIDAITEEILDASDLTTFQSAIERHEEIMSGVLGIKPVQEKLFSDFPGSIKSLGGWGGDFIMAASESDPADYFKTKGYPIVIRYRDMIK